MGVLGELFPGPKISDEAGEAGDGETFRLGPIDLEKGVVQLRRVPPAVTQPPATRLPATRPAGEAEQQD